MAKGEKKSKKKLAIIISSVAAVAVALGVAGFCISEETCSTALRRLLPVSLSFLTEQPFRVFQFRENIRRGKKALEEKEESFIKPLDISVDVNGVISKVTERISNILMTLSLYLMKSKMKQPIRLLKLQQAKRVTR